jgi:uncharacterized protein (TIGR03067 family)
VQGKVHAAHCATSLAAGQTSRCLVIYAATGSATAALDRAETGKRCAKKHNADNPSRLPSRASGAPGVVPSRRRGLAHGLLIKRRPVDIRRRCPMKVYMFVAIVALMLIPAVAGQTFHPPDEALLQGTWTIAALKVEKETVDVDQLKDARLVVSGSRYSFRLGDVDLEMTHKLDPTKSPKTMDMTITEGPAEGQTYHAIYELTGDRLMICRHVDPGKERPTTFATTPDSKLMLIVWKRLPR